MMGMFSLVLVLCLASSNLAVPRFSQKIVGGSLATIRQYPFTSSLLYSLNEVQYSQACGGTILTVTAVLTAAHCVVGDPASRWRVRVGSSYANSGGRVHLLRGYGYHSSFDPTTMVNDIAVLRTASIIQYNSFVGPATIAGPSYVLGDNEAVMAVGWGSVAPDSAASVNQQECRSRYAELGSTVTDNMVCSGWLDVGGRDQCQGDSGSPLIHNKVVVGICSWGYSCATPRYPGVNTRVSSFTAWIKSLV